VLWLRCCLWRRGVLVHGVRWVYDYVKAPGANRTTLYTSVKPAWGSTIAATPGPPPQFLARAAAIVTGLALLLVVEVRGAAFYAAWALIVLAFLSEAAATLVYWRRLRRSGPPG
jgi:hypothetical protein